MTPAFPGDKALIEACLRNEAGAWDEFIARYSKLVWWSVQRSLGRTRFAGRHDVASDLFQEVFGKIFEKKEVLRLEDPSGLKKFIVVLSANLTLDRVKALSRLEGRSVFLDADDEESLSDAGPIEAPEPGPAEAAQSREKEAAVAEALETLSPKERACLEMAVFDGQSHRQIALLLGLPPDTVSTLIRRAKDKVREKFEKKGF